MAILKAHREYTHYTWLCYTAWNHYNAQQCRYKLHQLHHRVHTSMPKVHLILHEEASMLSLKQHLRFKIR